MRGVLELVLSDGDKVPLFHPQQPLMLENSTLSDSLFWLELFLSCPSHSSAFPPSPCHSFVRSASNPILLLSCVAHSLTSFLTFSSLISHPSNHPSSPSSSPGLPFPFTIFPFIITLRPRHDSSSPLASIILFTVDIGLDVDLTLSFPFAALLLRPNRSTIPIPRPSTSNSSRRRLDSSNTSLASEPRKLLSETTSGPGSNTAT